MSNQYNPLTILRAGWSFLLPENLTSNLTSSFVSKNIVQNFTVILLKTLKTPINRGIIVKNFTISLLKSMGSIPVGGTTESL